MRNKRIISLILAIIMTLTLLTSCSLNSINDFLNELTDAQSDGFTPDMLVHFLDVGQGDAAFVELPNGETMLIDAGENYHGEGILDYITDRGYSKIDYLVATHPHSDHIGSMAYIVRNFDIGSVYMPKVSTNTKTYESLLTAISNKNLKIKNGKAGVNMIDDEALALEVNIIAPITIDESNLNNSSIVIRIDYAEASFLFTGDAEKGELAAVKEDMNADVLKVGHHGSRTSTTEDFLEKVNPQIAVISCGEGNDYGHPHESTLELLDEFHCETYRTDQDGTVIVMTDGELLDVQTGAPSIAKAK